MLGTQRIWILATISAGVLAGLSPTANGKQSRNRGGAGAVALPAGDGTASPAGFGGM
jgi:hypothetical protein